MKMEKYILFFLLFFFVCPNVVKNGFPYGIYNFVLKNKKFLIYKNDKIRIAFSEKFKNETYFRIVKLPNNNYNIENFKGNLKISVELEKIIFSNNKDLKKNGALEWSFIDLNDGNFIIQNKNGCFITLKNNGISCKIINVQKAEKFNIIKIYEEVNHSKEDIKLIEKEPIDILIKYIDLSDPILKKQGITKRLPDETNDDLKYSIRSILKNIPWIRKIFILMPNKKVKFFKEYKLIKEKIIYVFDRDLISSKVSNLAFHFRSWMMEKFNMSTNFILMNENYFIGQPLKKSDFFYVRNGKVCPLIITNNFEEINENLATFNLDNLKKKMLSSYSQSYFKYSIQSTYLFNIKLFNKTLIFPKFNNNAIPCNSKEVKEIYNLTYNSEYKYGTLYSLNKYNESLNFHTFYLGYTFNKYNKKINQIPFGIFQINKELKKSYEYPLFSINKYYSNFSSISSKRAKLIMEYYFPNPTPYEKIDSTFLPHLSYNVIYEMEKEKIILKQKYINFVKLLEMIILILLYPIYKKLHFRYVFKKLSKKK